MAKKLFKENTANKFGQEDPYFERVPATRLGFKKKKTKALPPGLTPEEERILTKAKRRAYRLDMCFSPCGFKFGLSALVGIIPMIGDAIDFLLALMVFRTCCSVEPPLSRSTVSRMQLNMIIDFAIGLVPFLGDIADAFYKCNTKNVVLLEKELRKRGLQRLTPAQRQNTVDPSLEDEYDYDGQGGVMVQEAPPPRYTPQKERRDDGRGDRSGRGTDRDLESGRNGAPQKPPRR